MKAKRAKQEFERLIQRSGMRVGSLSPARGLEMILAFYRTVRFDDVDLAGNGDMLLNQWGTYDWGEGESFEFDITRQLICVPSVSPIRNGFQGAFQMNRETVTANARIKRLVHKVRLKA